MWNPVRGQPRHAALLLNTLVGVFLTTVVAAAEVPAHGRSIAELLPRGQQTEGIFFSILPARSEDGRDAIRLPKLAETLLPSDSEAADETRFTVTTHWAASRETQSFPCVWQRSARGLSSELRLPDSAKTLNIPAKTILLLSRSRASTSRTRPEFDCSVIVPDRAADHELVLSHFGLSSGDALSGLFGIHSPGHLVAHRYAAWLLGAFWPGSMGLPRSSSYRHSEVAQRELATHSKRCSTFQRTTVRPATFWAWRSRRTAAGIWIRSARRR